MAKENQILEYCEERDGLEEKLAYITKNSIKWGGYEKKNNDIQWIRRIGIQCIKWT